MDSLRELIFFVNLSERPLNSSNGWIKISFLLVAAAHADALVYYVLVGYAVEGCGRKVNMKIGYEYYKEVQI